MGMIRIIISFLRCFIESLRVQQFILTQDFYSGRLFDRSESRLNEPERRQA